MTKEEFAKSLDCNIEDLDIVKLVEKGEYKLLYEDYVEYEKSFENDYITSKILSYEDFMKEFKKGYGKSGCIQVARLVELDDGIYYDRDYC